MFQYQFSNFDLDGKCRCKILMPGIDWILRNTIPSKWNEIIASRNKNKTIVSSYLDIIIAKIKMLIPKYDKAIVDEFNQVALKVASDSVHILIYGNFCTFPFCIPSTQINYHSSG